MNRNFVSTILLLTCFAMAGCMGDFQITSMPAWADAERIAESYALQYRHVVLDLRRGALPEFAYVPGQTVTVEPPSTVPAWLSVHVYCSEGPDGAVPVLVVGAGDKRRELLPTEYALAPAHLLLGPAPASQTLTLGDWTSASSMLTPQYRYAFPVDEMVALELQVRMLTDERSP